MPFFGGSSIYTTHSYDIHLTLVHDTLAEVLGSGVVGTLPITTADLSCSLTAEFLYRVRLPQGFEKFRTCSRMMCSAVDTQVIVLVCTVNGLISVSDTQTRICSGLLGMLYTNWGFRVWRHIFVPTGALGTGTIMIHTLSLQTMLPSTSEWRRKFITSVSPKTHHSKPHSCNMPQAKTEAALQFLESCTAEVALQHSLFCSAEVILTKSCAATSENCTATLESCVAGKWRFSAGFLRISRSHV